MVKKAKEVEINLYNFNAHDEQSKKNVKNKKKTKKKKKVNSEKNKTADTKFNFNNEIVIGIPKEETKKLNNKNVNKKKIKKETSKVKKKKVKKVISEKEREKIKKKRIKKMRIIKYTFLSVCIVSAIIATAMSPLFNIKQINIQGNNKITNEEIISLSQIKIDENTYKTNIHKAQHKILENPYINDVKIKRKIPDKIVIIIEERKPTYMLEYGSGYVYISNQGYILEISSQKLEVPIIQGTETIAEEFIPGNRLCINDLEKMSIVIKIMEVATNNDIANLITRIDIQNDQNYKLVFESEQKVANLGNGLDLSTKILNIKSILEKEKGVSGEIFVDMDLKTNNPIFRQNV